VLRKLQKVHICAALDARRKEELVRKRELSECKSAEERMRAMDAMHQTKQSMDAARTASGRKKYARQLQAYIIREHTRRIAMGGNDVTDLEVLIRAAFTDQQADHRRDRTTWGVPPPTEGVCEDAVQQWRDFLVQQRRHKALMLGTDLPTTRQVHAMRGAAWILRWDWAATTRIVRSTEVPQRASYQARQRRVFLHTREPIPWRTPPAAIYIDVLAGDEVLQVLTVCEPQILAVVRCTWGSLLGNGTIFTPSTADRAGHIWARPMTMEGVLADQIRIQERMREDGQEQIRPSPEAPVDAQKQLQDCIDMWHVSEDDELPGCSEPMLRTTVMRKKLVVDLSKPEYEAEFAESVQEAIVDGVHPILALQRAAELLMEEQAKRPGGANEAEGVGRERKHRRPSCDLESQLGRIAQARAACDARDPSVADMNGARMTDPALASACAEGKEDAFENMASALDRKEADLRMQAQFRQATASARKTEAEHDNAKKLWKHNRPAAFAEMTRRPDKEAQCSLLTKVEQVRDRGRVYTWAREGVIIDWNALLGDIYDPDPDGMWCPGDLLVGWNASTVIQPEAHQVDTPRRQPDDVPLQALRDWRGTRRQHQYSDWVESGRAAVPMGECEDVTWPSGDLDYTAASARLIDYLVRAWRSADYERTANNTVVFTVVDAQLKQDMSIEGLMAGSIPAEWLLMTDGSGSHRREDDLLPCGFAAILITRSEIKVAIGGCNGSTSGRMELAAALAGLQMLQGTAPRDGVHGADYLPWVKADLAKARASGFRNMSNVAMWQTSEGLQQELMAHSSNYYMHTKHTQSHDGEHGDWGQRMNEVTDAAAKLGRALANGMMTMPGPLPDLKQRYRVLPQWRMPTLRVRDLGEEMLQNLDRAVAEGEVALARKTRQGKAPDVMGVTCKLARKAPVIIDESIQDEVNKAFYVGQFPSCRPDGLIIGRHNALQKVPTGLRHLCGPEVMQNITSSILATRLLQASMSGKVMARKQKCNIPRVSGTNENNFLVQFAIYDFYAAAQKGLLEEGAVRIILLGDISKAFDRVQLRVLLHALRALFPGVDITRLSAIILSLYERTRIAVSKKEVTVLVEKLAGVHQGDPASAILFALLMEFVRRLIPPTRRYRMKFFTYDGELFFRMELDYADDEVRIVDSVAQMQTTVDDLRRVLKSVGLEWNPSKVVLAGLRYTRADGVHAFDPHISAGTNAQGETIWLKVIQSTTPGDTFVTLGLYLSLRGDTEMAARLVTDKVMARMRRTMSSPYPVVAKLEALRTVSERAAEYISFTSWLPPAALHKLDVQERQLVREFFGVNVPNSVFDVSMRIASRTIRQEVVYLASFVRFLGSTDHRVKAAALAMSRDAEGFHVPLTDQAAVPPFFGWKDFTPNLGSHSVLTDIPLRVASLARKWDLGIWEEDGQLRVTLDGHGIDEPVGVLQALNKKSKRLMQHKLENRWSTNENKTPPPEWSISWGLEGRKDPHRKRSTRFMGPESDYNDAEVRMIQTARMMLWPTNFAKVIRGERGATAACYCGAVQTQTHLLNVPWTCARHGLALRSLPRARHNRILHKIIKTVFAGAAESAGWRILAAESKGGEEPIQQHPDLQYVRDAISSARSRGLLRGEDEEQQHYRVDLAVVTTNAKQVYILDVCCGSDDKLASEDALIAHWKTARKRREPGSRTTKFWAGNWFTEDGRLSDQGKRRIPQFEHTRHVFKHSRYIRRYERLSNVIRRAMGGQCKVQVLPLAVGVLGLIPEFTRRYLKELFKARLASKVVDSMEYAAWDSMVQGNRAWQQETRNRLSQALDDE